MKKSDFWGLAYFAGLVMLLLIFLEPFIWLTKNYPYPMGFAKVALLATFGECLKTRLKTGNWIPSHLWQRFLVWGSFGVWFAWAFPLFGAGTEALVSKNLWFGFLPLAFSKSFIINFLGGYAYFMMLGHEYINKIIEKQGFVSAKEFKEKLEAGVWFPSKQRSCIPWTIFWFWLPAHTVTFLLPGHFQVLCAAFLSVALGFILTIKK